MRILLSCVALRLLIFSSLWATLYPRVSQQFPKTLTKIAFIFGQYDVRPLLPQIRTAQSLQLHLPTRAKDHSVTINVFSDILEEWLVVGACDYVMCT